MLLSEARNSRAIRLLRRTRARDNQLVGGLRDAQQPASVAARSSPTLATAWLSSKQTSSWSRGGEDPVANVPFWSGSLAGMEPDDLTTWAAEQSEQLLQPLGDRWKHVQGVAAQAREVAGALDPESRPCLLAAAWLHDIGYSPGLKRTGLHQLDGAAWLRAVDWRLACLVAHHSEARFEVTLRGHGEELAQYPREQSPVADALAFCDLMTGPSGQAMTLDERIAEVEQRYGAGDIVNALHQARPHLAAAIARTRKLLSRTG
jgi:hypothetical protein